MKICVFPADEWGCGHYRLTWPARALQDQGYDVDIIMPGESSGLHGIWVGDKLDAINVKNDADIFVFQRVTNIALLQLIEHLIARGKTVVVDMDDDLSNIHPDNLAFKLLHPRTSPHNNWQHATKACQIATLVTVSTPMLQQRYGTHRSRVLRNCVPQAFIDLPFREPEEPTWGWAGAVHSHPDDLPMIAGAVQSLRDSYLTVGYPEGTGKALGLTEDPPATGRIEFPDWSRALQSLSIGVAPLTDTKFNAGKSWLKPLEYAAVGIPWIASDRQEYRELWAAGGETGFIVGDRTKDWVRTLKRLLNDNELRREAGQQCRAVAAKFTIEQHAWSWMETWETAWKITQAASRPRRLEPPAVATAG